MLTQGLSPEEPVRSGSDLEVSEWKPPIGILQLKLTRLPGGKIRTIELGVIKQGEPVNGKINYKFCRFASIFHSSDGTNYNVLNREDDDESLGLSGKYTKGGLSVEYKNLITQDEMVEFLKGFNPTALHQLFNTLSDIKSPYFINDHNKLMLTSSVQRVIEDSSHPHHNHRH